MSVAASHIVAVPVTLPNNAQVSLDVEYDSVTQKINITNIFCAAVAVFPDIFSCRLRLNGAHKYMVTDSY